MRSRGATRWAPLGLALAGAMVGCSPRPDLDGLYRVTSYTLNQVSCAQPGAEIEPEFPRFRIEGRSFFGVTIYPVYPCAEDGVCSENNHELWNLVTVEEDLDKVSMTTAASAGDSCVLGSVDLVIDRIGGRFDGEVVLQRRTRELAIEPYDATTCTTDRAEAARDEMACVELLQLVGAPEAAGTM